MLNTGLACLAIGGVIAVIYSYALYPLVLFVVGSISQGLRDVAFVFRKKGQSPIRKTCLPLRAVGLLQFAAVLLCLGKHLIQGLPCFRNTAVNITFVSGSLGLRVTVQSDLLMVNTTDQSKRQECNDRAFHG